MPSQTLSLLRQPARRRNSILAPSQSCTAAETRFTAISSGRLSYDEESQQKEPPIGNLISDYIPVAFQRATFLAAFVQPGHLLFAGSWSSLTCRRVAT